MISESSQQLSSGAVLSECRNYRYNLWRIWGPSQKRVMFIGLNPSTADESVDDRTIRRCIAFSKFWGYDGLFMTNLFAYRATKPKDMLRAIEPVGADCDRTLIETSQKVELVVAAWGMHGGHAGRDNNVRKLLPKLHYLALTKFGKPRHPLYLRSDLRPILWKI